MWEMGGIQKPSYEELEKQYLDLRRRYNALFKDWQDMYGKIDYHRDRANQYQSNLTKAQIKIAKNTDHVEQLMNRINNLEAKIIKLKNEKCIWE